MKRLAAASALSVLLVAPSQADMSTSFDLACTYEYSIVDGKIIGTSAEETLGVVVFDDGLAVVTKVGLSTQLSGTISDDLIKAEATYRVNDDVSVKDSVEINRYTGRFMMKLQSEFGAPMLYFGRCRLKGHQF